MDSFNYTFAVLRGIQAGREFYVVMCPLKLIPKIFLFDEEEIPPELRAQRTLNRARVPEIARYLLDNPTEYVFSSITASIDGEVSFEPRASKGQERNVGSLVVPMTARFLINDGQHRRAAIEEALKENPQLGDETVSVVFFIDAGLGRSQQLFADLNTHAVRPSKSLGILYDKREPFSRLALSLAVFRGLTENATLSRINQVAKAAQMPVEAQKVVPQTTDTFWVNMIGRGYPAPHSKFRWCTERRKIKPADKFILSKVAQHGEVVLILGQRRSESATRAHVMEEYRITGHRLSRHSTLPRAYVYTPIEDFTTDDVWTYLLTSPSPWGGENRDLASLYRSAQSGECPLVVDLSTPSCGGSRFGLGRGNDQEQVEYAVELVTRRVELLHRLLQGSSFS